MKDRVAYLAALGLTAVALVIGIAAEADGSAVRLEPADRAGGKTLAYVEPLRFKGSYEGENYRPTRLYVEYRDGSTWLYTPCKKGDRRTCFRWFNDERVPFIKHRGVKTYL